MFRMSIADCTVLVLSVVTAVVMFLYKRKHGESVISTVIPSCIGIAALISLISGMDICLAWGCCAAFIVTGLLFLKNRCTVTPTVVAEVPNDTPDENVQFLEILQEYNHHIRDAFEEEIKLSNLLDYITKSTMDFFKADGAAIFLVDEFDDVINVKSSFGEFTPCYKLQDDLPHKPLRVQTNFKYAQFPFGESIFGETVVSGKPCYIQDGTKDERVYHNEPEEFLVPGSYIIQPLSVAGSIIGIMALSRKHTKEPFSPENFEMCCTAAKFASIAINNVYAFQEVIEHEAIKTELSIAANIQKTLQPQKLLDLPNLNFGMFFLPAKGICGDYLDVIPVRKDRICLAIGDIAGKGMQASHVMIMIRSILRLIANSTKDVATILEWTNKGITGRVDMDHYASFSIVFLNMEDHSLEYASAGHPPMLIWRKSTAVVERVALKSDPMGVERSTVFEKLKLTIDTGDIIILYTDGIVEALDKEGNQYGIDRLSLLISENSTLSAKDISNKIKNDIKVFCGTENQHDDQSLLVVKVTA